MKTNQVLNRTMGDFEVEQRTSDGMFNATELLKQWNQWVKLNTQNSGYLKKQKDLDDFFSNKSTLEYIDVIIKRENLKERNSVFIKSRGRNGGTWMHPFLFMDFAMWLNTDFKYEVVKFVYDQLIAYRNEAGDTYKNMCSEIAKITPKDKLTAVIQSTARGINYIVYGDHERNIRNLQAEENLMRELVEMQKKVTMYIEDGVITNPSGILQLLRNTWRRKYEPKTLTA